MFNDGVVIRRLLHGVKHKPLDKQEEARLLRKAKRGNQEARDRLVEANQRFVIRMALMYRNCGIALSDLIQEGTLGLIEAIDRYDAKRECRLISYAAWWIRLYIQRSIEQKSRTVNIPINKIATLKKIRDFEYGFVKQNGRKPYMSEIADKIGLNEEKVTYVYNIGTTTLSLHAEDDEGQTIEDWLECSEVEVLHEKLLQDELKTKMDKVLANLTPKEQDVIRCRFGLDDQAEPLSLRQAGRRLGLSAEGVRQIQAQAFKKLSDPTYCGNLFNYVMS